ncbi:hypothetical protein Pcinc_029233 [Petrolisthes cinctipes]|uniref:Uncharacterized protein n=1 Tax=Petrolisthes cinctipes TaxID=88211 RepID=A0AAE1F1F5_PETCI|nr:hypothetical protein Pcinc_029233 [Petrolisthes cinctipes]
MGIWSTVLGQFFEGRKEEAEVWEGGMEEETWMEEEAEALSPSLRTSHLPQALSPSSEPLTFPQNISPPSEPLTSLRTSHLPLEPLTFPQNLSPSLRTSAFLWLTVHSSI